MTSEKIFEQLFVSYPALSENRKELSEAYSVLLNAAKTKSLIMVCGNGGSAADSEHIVGELLKGFNLKRPLSENEKESFALIENGDFIADKLQGAIPALSLVSQIGLISAFANDVEPSLVFAQQVWAYSRTENDVLLALSTSGNSENVVNAVKAAKAKGIKSIAVTGENQSKLSELADVTIKLPFHTPYQVQELTLPVYHALCAMLEAELW